MDQGGEGGKKNARNKSTVDALVNEIREGNVTAEVSVKLVSYNVVERIDFVENPTVLL